MLSKTRITINQTESINDDYYDSGPKYILDKGMMFSYKISADTTTSRALNEIEYDIIQHELVYDESKGERVYKETTLNLTDCDRTYFDPGFMRHIKSTFPITNDMRIKVMFISEDQSTLMSTAGSQLMFIKTCVQIAIL